MTDNWFELEFCLNHSYLYIQVGDISLVGKRQGFQKLEHEALDILEHKYLEILTLKEATRCPRSMWNL